MCRSLKAEGAEGAGVQAGRGNQGRDSRTGESGRAQLCLLSLPRGCFSYFSYGSSQSSILSAESLKIVILHIDWLANKKGASLHCNAKLCTSAKGTPGASRTFRSLLSAWDKSWKRFDFSQQMSQVSQHELQYSATVNSRKDWWSAQNSQHWGQMDPCLIFWVKGHLFHHGQSKNHWRNFWLLRIRLHIKFSVLNYYK